MPVTFTQGTTSPSTTFRKQHTILEKGYRSEDGNISGAFDNICERFTHNLNEKKKAGLDLNDCKCMAFFAIEDHIPSLDTDTLMNANNRRLLDFSLTDRDTIESRLKAQFKTKGIDYKKVLTSLKDELIKLVERPPIIKGRHIQVAGSIGHDPEHNSLCVIKGVTHSQERANKSALHDKDASNANLACISFDETLTVGRSGCPDSKTKVLELLQFLGFMELEKKVASGDFSPDTHSTFDASEVFMVTLMDLAIEKQVAETLSKKTEMERIKDIQTAVRDLTPNDLICSTAIDGKRILVRLKKPELSVCPFSFSTSQAMADARAAKKAPYTRKFDRFVKQWGSETSEPMRSIVTAMKQEPKNFTAIFEEVGRIIQSAERRSIEIPKQTLGALNALKIGLSDDKTTFDGMNLAGDKTLGTRNPETAIEFIFDVMLTRELGDILTVSCKSGQDRTGTAAAIVVALDNYKEITGQDFLPTTEKKPWEDSLFKFLFTMGIDDFCESFHRITRGEGVDLKPGKHPAFNRLYVSNPAERASLKTEIYSRPDVQTYNLDSLYTLPDLKEDPSAGEFIRNFQNNTSTPASNLAFWSNPGTQAFLTDTLPKMIHDAFDTFDAEDNEQPPKRLDLHLQPTSPVITFKDKSIKRSSVIPFPFSGSVSGGGGTAAADALENDRGESERRPTRSVPRSSGSFSSGVLSGLKRLSSSAMLTPKPRAASANEPEDATSFHDNPMLLQTDRTDL
jgi:hypothetical protein